jgi:hypothetical protein
MAMAEENAADGGRFFRAAAAGRPRRGSEAVASGSASREWIWRPTTLFNSPGKVDGALREIDTSDVTEGVAQRVWRVTASRS